MGYDVHITRAENWLDSEESPITLQDWQAYLNSDPEFRLDGFAETSNPQGEMIRIESQGLAVWTKYSKHGVRGTMAWFDWSEGQIVVKNPDEEILEKMRAVAKRLEALVQGDDGESYDDPTPSSKPAASRPVADPKPWWKRLLGG